MIDDLIKHSENVSKQLDLVALKIFDIIDNEIKGDYFEATLMTLITIVSARVIATLYVFQNTEKFISMDFFVNRFSNDLKKLIPNEIEKINIIEKAEKLNAAKQNKNKQYN